MLRSLYSGISGLRAHQTMLDVTGNNIANVNTAGFKGSSVQFEDTLSQLTQAASGPQPNAGGTNPAQVGLGVRIAAVTTNFGQGSAQTTGKATDMMISGDGFFVTSRGGQQLYTRAGAFGFDAGGRLVGPDGGILQGWTANPADGTINTGGPLGDLILSPTQTLQPKATKNVAVEGNLPAEAKVGDPALTREIEIFDANGEAHKLEVSFTRTADGWDVAAPGGTVSLTLGTDGKLTPADATLVSNGIDISLGGLTGYAGLTTVAATSQDGYRAGTLEAFGLQPDGSLVGSFSNGIKQVVGRIALARFANPEGLEKSGQSAYTGTANSGGAQIGAAGDPGFGTLAGGALEMSNVDLSQEFTNLIVAQRGFQANARIITSSDQVLQELVDLKR